MSRYVSAVCWGLGGALLCVVWIALTWRWFGAGRAAPPSGWTGMLVGVAGLLGGLRWRWLWVAGWIGVASVVVELLRIYAEHPNMTLPAMYWATFGGAGLCAAACTIDLWRAWSTRPRVKT